jgi:hypothetical protein
VQTQNENGIQVQINSLEVRVNEQSVELNNLKTVQAYPKEYVSLLFSENVYIFTFTLSFTKMLIYYHCMEKIHKNTLSK